MKIVFTSGTGTDCGKTFSVALLAFFHLLKYQNSSVYIFKPVETFALESKPDSKKYIELIKSLTANYKKFTSGIHLENNYNQSEIAFLEKDFTNKIKILQSLFTLANPVSPHLALQKALSSLPLLNLQQEYIAKLLQKQNMELSQHEVFLELVWNSISNLQKTLSKESNYRNTLLIIEGAGGLLSEMVQNCTNLYMWNILYNKFQEKMKLKPSIILSTTAGLGTINSTLLSYERLQNEGLPVSSVFLQQILNTTNLEMANSNRNEIDRRSLDATSVILWENFQENKIYPWKNYEQQQFY